MLLLLVGAGCSSPTTFPPSNEPYGIAWLATNAPPPADPKVYDARPTSDISGVLTAIDGTGRPPMGWRTWFEGEETKHSLTIHADDGFDWVVGYELGRGEEPGVDQTPTLPLVVGAPVRLLFRAIFSFGRAAGFVLSDRSGVVFALDLAVYGDPLQASDVEGLTMSTGAALDTVKHDCYDQRNTALVFGGDAPVEARPGESRTVSIKGVSYTALTIFSFESIGEIRCTDVAGEGRAWAIWRAP